MKKKAAWIVCLCFIFSMFRIPAKAISINEFSDVDGHWAKGYIEILCDQNIINGYRNGTFAPDNALTKAEAAKLVCLSAGIIPNKTIETDIADIDKHWAREYIAVLPVVPAPENLFSPDTYITRSEFAQMVIGAMYIDTESADISSLKRRFKDWASIATEEMPYIALAVEKGVINGYEDATFRPDNTLTRGEACTMLKRAFFPDVKLTPSHYYIDTVAYANKVIQMACAADGTLYYVANNNIYRAGQNGAVLRGDELSVTAAAKQVLEQPKTSIKNGWVTIQNVQQQLERDQAVTFSDFTIVGTVADMELGHVYAIAWSVVEDYEGYELSDDLYIVAAFDITAPDMPVAEFFNSGSNSERMGIPNGDCLLLSGNSLYYSSGYDPNDYTNWNAQQLRWDWSSARVTKYADFGIHECAESIVDGTLWYVTKGYNSNTEMIQLDSNVNYTLSDDRCYAIGAWKNDFYFWNENELALYRTTLSSSDAKTLSTKRLVSADSLIIKDGYQFYKLDYMDFSLWAAGSDNVFFFDYKNGAIRRIYGK